jgi:FkbM family methyltransferase
MRKYFLAKLGVRSKQIARAALNALLDLRACRSGARVLAKSGLFPQRFWSGYPVRETIQYPVGSRTFQYEVHPGDYVGMPLYWLGPKGYEPETAEILFKALAGAEVFFDIGANTGFFSLLAAHANPTVKVWAFEPSPQSFAQLRHHVAVNRLENRIVPVNVAITDHVGTTKFFIPDGVFSLSASLSAGGMPPDRAEISVATESIDHFCLTHPAPSVIKLDVEGQEHLALRGMQRILRENRPKIVIEVLTDGPNNEIQSILQVAGYRFGHITATGVVWRDEIAGDPTGANRNWLCLPD